MRRAAASIRSPARVSAPGACERWPGMPEQRPNSLPRRARSRPQRAGAPGRRPRRPARARVRRAPPRSRARRRLRAPRGHERRARQGAEQHGKEEAACRRQATQNGLPRLCEMAASSNACRRRVVFCGWNRLARLPSVPIQSGGPRARRSRPSPPVFGGGRGGGGDGSGRCAADVAQPVRGGELAHGVRIDHPASDAALHDDVAEVVGALPRDAGGCRARHTAILAIWSTKVHQMCRRSELRRRRERGDLTDARRCDPVRPARRGRRDQQAGRGGDDQLRLAHGPRGRCERLPVYTRSSMMWTLLPGGIRSPARCSSGASRTNTDGSSSRYATTAASGALPVSAEAIAPTSPTAAASASTRTRSSSGRPKIRFRFVTPIARFLARSATSTCE